MTTGQSGMQGHAPSVKIEPIKDWQPKNPEQSKYEKLWATEAYRQVSPGEMWAQTFLKQANVKMDSDAIDFGCGTGRGALMLALFGGMKVTMLDFAANCLDPEVAQALETQNGRLKFHEQDLTKPIPVSAAYGYCCDVMEHIPTEDVQTVLKNILGSAHHVFFGISTVDDVMGALIGEPLHLSVYPMSWWLEQLVKAGATIHWSQEETGACAIYCSAWQNAGDIIKTGVINVTEDVINAQCFQNISDGWSHVQPHDKQDREIVLLAGGPSMPQHAEEIRMLRESGCALVTVNGAYKWAIDHGLTVSAQIVLDAREFNARFTQPVKPDTRYLIASQVHPSTLAGLPKERTLLWHTNLSDENEKLVREITGHFFPTPGGSTVILRAIPLLRMLGYWRFHIFGFDSCLQGQKHHGYVQTENDNQPVVPLTCGGRTFDCAPWMVSQAAEFQDLVKFLGDEVELCVYGDGLISQIIATGASFSKTE